MSTGNPPWVVVRDVAQAGDEFGDTSVLDPVRFCWTRLEADTIAVVLNGHHDGSIYSVERAEVYQ